MKSTTTRFTLPNRREIALFIGGSLLAIAIACTFAYALVGMLTPEC